MPETQQVDLFEIDTDMLEAPAPVGACINYESCENVTPGAGKMCGECLDLARNNVSTDE